MIEYMCQACGLRITKADYLKPPLCKCPCKTCHGSMMTEMSTLGTINCGDYRLKIVFSELR